MNHCVAKIHEIIKSGRDDRRSILQLGYNLGRLSELSGLGRAPFWDAWVDPIERWDRPRLLELAHDLLTKFLVSPPETERDNWQPNPSPP